jgi:hypothetical protein
MKSFAELLIRPEIEQMAIHPEPFDSAQGRLVGQVKSFDSHRNGVTNGTTTDIWLAL